MIDFVAKLHHLDSYEAAKLLSIDFGLTETSQTKPPRKKSIIQPLRHPCTNDFCNKETYCIRVLCDYLHLLEDWQVKYAPLSPQDTDYDDRFVESCQMLTVIENYADLLITADLDGEWIKTDPYITFLRRLCQSFHLKVTNNHALRMSLNSNALIPLGVSVADRAAMLGHSIETNLKHYSFAQKGYLEQVCALLDGEDEPEPPVKSSISADLSPASKAVPEKGTPSKVLIFKQKESPKPLISQRFQTL